MNGAQVIVAAVPHLTAATPIAIPDNGLLLHDVLLVLICCRERVPTPGGHAAGQVPRGR